MGHISSPPFPVGAPPPRGASSWTATVWYSRNLGPFPGNHCHVPCGHSLLFPRLVVSRQGSVVVSFYVSNPDVTAGPEGHLVGVPDIATTCFLVVCLSFFVSSVIFLCEFPLGGFVNIPCLHTLQ